MSLAFQDLMPLTSGTDISPSVNSVGRIRSADQSVRVVVGGAMPTDARLELDLALPLGGWKNRPRLSPQKSRKRTSSWRVTGCCG